MPMRAGCTDSRRRCRAPGAPAIPRDRCRFQRPRGNQATAQQKSMARCGMKPPPPDAPRRSDIRSRLRPAPAGLSLCGRAVQHGLCRFLYLSDPALRPVARARRLRDRHPRRGAIDPRPVPVDPYRRSDGPVRHARGDARVRLDRDAAGAAVSTGTQFLGPVAAAAGQRRGRFLCLVGRADPDRAARRGRCAIYRQVQLFRPARLDLGADRRRGGVGFRRRVAGLSARVRMGRGADRRIAAHAGGRVLPAASGCRHQPAAVPRPRHLASPRPTISTRSC